jgi:hypothetical protein
LGKRQPITTLFQQSKDTGRESLSIRQETPLG